MAHYGIAHYVYAPQERWKEALAESRLASELDPLSPLIAMSEPWLAVLERRYDAALDGFRKLDAANSRDIAGALPFALSRKRRLPGRSGGTPKSADPDAVLPDARFHRFCAGSPGKSNTGPEDSPATAGGTAVRITGSLEAVFIGVWERPTRLSVTRR